MKKLVCLVLALVCFATVAMAESVPSKSTADMVTVEVKGNPGGVLVEIVEDIPENRAVIAKRNEEIEKLAASASAVAYFGEVKNVAGETVTLADDATVAEFEALAVSGYEETMGNLTVDFQLATPYAVGETATMLIGIVAEDGAVEWTAFEAVGTGVNGAIEVEFTPEVLLAIQNGTGLMAVTGGN